MDIYFLGHEVKMHPKLRDALDFKIDDVVKWARMPILGATEHGCEFVPTTKEIFSNRFVQKLIKRSF